VRTGAGSDALDIGAHKETLSGAESGAHAK
jgi:hypothetical protein